jgi:cellulose synthase/poly-beta-1,6-N-acetylglucosamine synthase-like glycosyltransferase
MKLTFTIQVCNESRELFSLLNFLLKVKDDEDNIQVVVDSLHTTDKVKLVLEKFKDKVTIYERPFDNFYENCNFHNEKATGDYIFGIDADEMPQEDLIKNIKNVIRQTDTDLIWVPRINIHPGSTEEFIKKSNFHVNENGWINWPDYQGRILKNDGTISWTKELHTKLQGATKPIILKDIPGLALWHIKSIEKQDIRWLNGAIRTEPSENLYELLM